MLWTAVVPADANHKQTTRTAITATHRR